MCFRSLTGGFSVNWDRLVHKTFTFMIAPFLKKIYADDKLVDTYTTRFGIRSIEYIADKGFYLNGEHRKFQGVCNHHDLGPLGAAINVAALRHQLTLLKDMGCDAIRTSHNMPTPELVALCDDDRTVR